MTAVPSAPAATTGRVTTSVTSPVTSSTERPTPAASTRPRSRVVLTTLWRFLLRYGPADVICFVAEGAVTWATTRAGLAPALVVTLAVVVGGVVFYATVGLSVGREQWRATADLDHRTLRTTRRTLALLVAEFGPAELLDSLLVRPALMAIGLALLPAVPGVILGSFLANLVFYTLAAISFQITLTSGVRAPGTTATPQPVPTPSLSPTPAEVHTPSHAPSHAQLHHVRALRVLHRPEVRADLARHGTPLLVLERASITRRYTQLRTELPFVRAHYAVKALSHEAVIAAVGTDGWFDVASTGEVDLLRRCGVPGERIIHTHPVKTRAQIEHALAAGVRTFVVDSAPELAKLRPDDGATVLVRIAYRTPDSLCDLSAKFGAEPTDAAAIVRHGLALGLDVAGFSFHVGSQVTRVQPWIDAVTRTLALIDELAAEGARLRVLDIGGGLPAAYDRPVIGPADLATALGPLLEPRLPELLVLAEPGRFVVADAATLITSVVGTATREGVHWAYLDDGVYGSYSNVTFEGLTPPFVVVPGDDARRPVVTTTLAGPTCDSVDVPLRAGQLPRLEAGDLVLSPMMGAYTAVSATGFNGLAPTRVLVV